MDHSRNKSTARIALRIAVAAFYVVTAAVIVDYVRKIDVEALLSLSLEWRFLFAALILSILSRFVISGTFRVILSTISGGGINWNLCNYAYARSWIGRYSPGKVAGLLARMVFFSPLGATHEGVILASVLEVSLNIFMCALFGFAGLALSGSILALDPMLQKFAALVAVSSLLILWPPVLNFLLLIALKLLGRSHLAEGLRVDYKAVMGGFWGSLIVQIVCGVMYWLLVASLNPEAPITLLPFLLGVFGLAGALGLAAFFTPAGLGVREMVLLPFLTKILSAEASLAMLGLVRLVELAADLVYLAMSIAMVKLRKPAEKTV
ncbi:hypothetical protein EPN96_00805 [bacterium]|nr:MAG: hypothetical protein EPN96_00805 [bacterium]